MTRDRDALTGAEGQRRVRHEVSGVHYAGEGPVDPGGPESESRYERAQGTLAGGAQGPVTRG